MSLLGGNGDLQFAQGADELKVKMPTDQPCKYAFTLKITGLEANPPGPPVPAMYGTAGPSGTR